MHQWALDFDKGFIKATMICLKIILLLLLKVLFLSEIVIALLD